MDRIKKELRIARFSLFVALLKLASRVMPDGHATVKLTKTKLDIT